MIIDMNSNEWSLESRKDGIFSVIPSGFLFRPKLYSYNHITP